MNQYETVIVLTPLLSEEAAKEVITKFTSIISDGGAEIIAEDNWGLRKLAYPIDKKANGFFHLTEYKSNGEVVSKLELELKRDERVLRFLTVRLDRHAVAYNEKKRSGAFNKKPKKEEATA
jgi:small subunit ribosomal protein S6